MNNINELKNKIIDANIAYRNGNPIYTDTEYDQMLENYEQNVSSDEYNAFRNSLNDSDAGYGTDVKHAFIMGSLDKIKNSDNTALSKFLTNRCNKKLNVSAKVDGISCRITYKNGKLVEAATRGDGYLGKAITDKIKYVKYVPTEISNKSELHVRGELVILSDDCIGLTTNPRNVCAGVINRKEWLIDDVSKISFIAYTILGDKYQKTEQFEILKNLGFNIAWYNDLNITDIDSDMLTDFAKTKFDYEIDGLVLTGSDSKNELDAYRPKNAMAFKINELNAVSKVIDISWDGPSKDGFMIPVAVLEPVEIGGAVISRASVHNLDILKALNIKYGSIVEINKANDIIPQISKVISNENAVNIVYPTECPCCGGELVKDINEVNYRCNNKMCRVQMIGKMEHFIKSLNVENASFKTLEKFGIDTFEKLIDFRPDITKKSETKFMKELSNKVFSASEPELFCSINMRGLGHKILNKLVDYYTWDVIKNTAVNNTELPVGMPFGIGGITIEKFKSAYIDNVINTLKISNDPRYTGHITNKNEHITETKKGSICFTGSLVTMGRKEAASKAAAAGYEVKSSVGKGLTYLVTNDPGSGSSKNEKARKLGVKVIDEQEFISIVSPNAVETDIMNF